MHIFLNPYWWTAGFTALVQFVLFVRWLYRRIRNDEITRAFVRDMAVHHLPHIYFLLEQICERQGIKHTENPRIHWVNLNDKPH